MLWSSVQFFFIARLFVKKEIENTTAPKATMHDILHAVLVVGCLLILVYLSTAGHVWAAISFAVIMFIAQIWGNYIVRKNASYIASYLVCYIVN